MLGHWPAWLPRGGSLPEASWQARHRGVVALLWFHVVAIPIYAVLKDNSLAHAWVETAPVMMAALLAGHLRLSRRAQELIAAGGLMICSAVVVHLAEGLVEAHFHFFVMIPVIALYEAWAPFTLALGCVLAHHTLMGLADPRSVYNHPAAWERPWVFAFVHAAFFACAAIACVINWWVHERSRETAHAQSELLGTVMDSLRDGLVVLDSRHRVRLRNPAGVALMGGEDLESRGLGPESYGLFHPDGSPVSYDDLPHAQALAGRAARDVDLVVRNRALPGGRVLNFSAATLPSPDAGGGQDVVVVFRDVTEQHRTEQAMATALAAEQEMVERLRDIERVKSDFVATASHELRTPLTSILGYLEVLTDGSVGELDGTQTAIVERIERNGQRLLSLVEDLLTLSKIESSRLRIDAVVTDLRTVVARALDGIAWLLESRVLTIDVDVPERPVRQSVDPDELERMLVNLLTNAVKFTPDGGLVKVRLTDDGRVARIVVSDNGIGIPTREQARLFTRFFRSSLATEQAIQGTGLGLTIVQAIVGLHGGTIAVESVPDEGTTVTVELPHRAAKEAGAAPGPKAAVSLTSRGR